MGISLSDWIILHPSLHSEYVVCDPKLNGRYLDNGVLLPKTNLKPLPKLKYMADVKESALTKNTHVKRKINALYFVTKILTLNVRRSDTCHSFGRYKRQCHFTGSHVCTYT